VERKWWTLLASCIAIFMLLLDVTIVNVALPSIERDLGANFTDLEWVIDAYALTLAGFVLAAGSLADMVGRRLVFMLGLAVFSASSLACGLAPDPLFLNVSRAAQGVWRGDDVRHVAGADRAGVPGSRTRNCAGHLGRHHGRGSLDRAARGRCAR